MTYFSDSLHHLVLHINGRKPRIAGELKGLVEQGIRTLPVRYPGLQVVHQAVYPDRVELLLDFQRLDEDVLRVAQSFKSEVKNLAKKKGFIEEPLWQWNYEDHWIATPVEMREVERAFPPPNDSHRRPAQDSAS
jgi:hypothetical protein